LRNRRRNWIFNSCIELDSKSGQHWLNVKTCLGLSCSLVTEFIICTLLLLSLWSSDHKSCTLFSAPTLALFHNATLFLLHNRVRNKSNPYLLLEVCSTDCGTYCFLFTTFSFSMESQIPLLQKLATRIIYYFFFLGYFHNPLPFQQLDVFLLSFSDFRRLSGKPAIKPKF